MFEKLNRALLSGPRGLITVDVIVLVISIMIISGGKTL
jgi:hypothetical protein